VHPAASGIRCGKPPLTGSAQAVRRLAAKPYRRGASGSVYRFPDKGFHENTSLFVKISGQNRALKGSLFCRGVIFSRFKQRE
jgi:hypothetical protein